MVARCLPLDHHVGPADKASASIDLGFDSRFCRWDFSRLSHTSDFNICTPGVTLPMPGIIGSALGLVCPVSEYCEWVR